jgi:ferritin-like metal-binding protein YciE
LAFLNITKKVENVEISDYNGLIELAERLDLDEEVMDLLHKNLEEDEDAMKKLGKTF